MIHSSAFRRLQGKTQLFPGLESDFFRNRLTHSLEVGQIAKSIAIRLNATEHAFDDTRQNHRVDPDLCEFAGWCHDLGHPPFGHNGEEALHERMTNRGGWEGNAQTLRILARLAKRQIPRHGHPTGISDSGHDDRVGLNLTARSLAAILKYDEQIPARSRGKHVHKGYYAEESELVDWIKSCVLGTTFTGKFKTLECQIMDLADDIAYSTYDLEDAFHAGFLDPAKLMAASHEVLTTVASRVESATGERCSHTDVLDVLREVFQGFPDPRLTLASDFDKFRHLTAASANFGSEGGLRTSFTSQLVGEFIQSIQFEPNQQHPQLSRVFLPPNTMRTVEVLKRLSFVMLIESPRLRITRYRGKEIVKFLFDAIDKDPELLPSDWLAVHRRLSKSTQPRLVADFIGCMTDRYAIEYYGRLRSEAPQTIFKPL